MMRALVLCLAIAACRVDAPTDVQFACAAAADCAEGELCLGGVCAAADRPYLGDPRQHDFADSGFGGYVNLYRFELRDERAQPLPGGTATQVHVFTRNVDTDPRFAVVVYVEDRPAHLTRVATAQGTIAESAWASAPLAFELSAGASYWLGFATASAAPDHNQLASTLSICAAEPGFAAPHQCATDYYWQAHEFGAPFPDAIDVMSTGEYFSPSLYIDYGPAAN